MTRLQGKTDRERLGPKEKARLEEFAAAKLREMMEADLQAPFYVRKASSPIPSKAKLLHGLICDACGEKTVESRVRLFLGKVLCIPCFEKQQRGKRVSSLLSRDK